MQQLTIEDFKYTIEDPAQFFFNTTQCCFKFGGAVSILCYTTHEEYKKVLAVIVDRQTYSTYSTDAELKQKLFEMFTENYDQAIDQPFIIER